MFAPIIAWFVGKAVPWVLHQISRAWGVFLVGAIALAIFLWVNGGIAKIKAKECKACIAEYTTTHPTYNNVGTVVNNDIRTIGLEIDKFGIGVWHRR